MDGWRRSPLPTPQLKPDSQATSVVARRDLRLCGKGLSIWFLPVGAVYDRGYLCTVIDRAYSSLVFSATERSHPVLKQTAVATPIAITLLLVLIGCRSDNIHSGETLRTFLDEFYS